jgi:hypothetical protein
MGYRVRKLIPHTLRAYFGVASCGDEPDIVISRGEGIPNSDGHLLYSVLCAEWFWWDGKKQPPLIDELRTRGYDITTLKFSIKKKEPA